MKKMIMIIVAAAFSTAVMAQESKTEASESPAAEHPAKHECYAMKEAGLMHCMGTKAEAQEQDVKLENGMVITTAGKIVGADGEEATAMKKGQCCDMMGKVMDCKEMHEGMMKEEEPSDE